MSYVSPSHWGVKIFAEILHSVFVCVPSLSIMIIKSYVICHMFHQVIGDQNLRKLSTLFSCVYREPLFAFAFTFEWNRTIGNSTVYDILIFRRESYSVRSCNIV